MHLQDTKSNSYLIRVIGENDSREIVRTEVVDDTFGQTKIQ